MNIRHIERHVERYVRGAVLQEINGARGVYCEQALTYVLAYLAGSRQPAPDAWLLALALDAQAVFGPLPRVNTDSDPGLNSCFDHPDTRAALAPM